MNPSPHPHGAYIPCPWCQLHETREELGRLQAQVRLADAPRCVGRVRFPNVGVLLKRVREQRGLSVRAFGAQLGVSGMQVCRLEKGMAKLGTIQKALNRLGVPVEHRRRALDADMKSALAAVA